MASSSWRLLLNGPVAVGPSRRTWSWLAVGIALQLLANGRWIVAPAAWVAPLPWLLFLDRSTLRRGIPVALPCFLVVELIAWRGLVPAPGLLYFLIVGVYGVVYFLPFLVHRLLARRVVGFASTLIFPSAWVAIEFAFQRWGTPYGSWFSIAYTQDASLPLLQLAAYTGTAGISFLMTWFASVAAWALDAGPEPKEWRSGAIAFVLVFAGCWALGEARLASRPKYPEPVRVAGLVPSPDLTRQLEEALAPARQGTQLAPDGIAAIADIADRLNGDLFARSVREARAGARLVAWSETAGRVLARDEPAFLRRARSLARAEDVHLVLAYGVWFPDSVPPFENKVVAVSRSGVVEWEFLKANPIVGPESPFVRAGDGVVRTMSTGFGSVGAVICHDLDFPGFLRRAHRLRIDLVVGPSADWPAITPLHANMAAVRAIESGFSLFRPTSNGRSLAVDSRGRPWAVVDYAYDAVVASVPVASAGTLYGSAGDWFAWTCLAGLVIGAGIILGRTRPGRASD